MPTLPDCKPGRIKLNGAVLVAIGINTGLWALLVLGAARLWRFL